MSSFVLLYWAEYFVPGKLALAAFLMCTGAVMFLAAGVIIHSTAFWAGPIENLARHAWEFVIAFSLYPVTIHTGFLKVMMFTLIPAGFISYFPVELLRDFSVLSFLTVLGATTFYSALALFVFARGLQQYESGNRIMLRT